MHRERNDQSVFHCNGLLQWKRSGIPSDGDGVGFEPWAQKSVDGVAQLPMIWGQSIPSR